MKVYIVIWWCTGEEGVDGVFSTRELAEAHIASSAVPTISYGIEEWEVDRGLLKGIS